MPWKCVACAKQMLVNLTFLLHAESVLFLTFPKKKGMKPLQGFNNKTWVQVSRGFTSPLAGEFCPFRALDMEDTGCWMMDAGNINREWTRISILRIVVESDFGVGPSSGFSDYFLTLKLMSLLSLRPRCGIEKSA